MSKTLFEKIIDGEIPSEKVYEDNDFLAFLDINPVNPGHTLLIPKRPYKNLYEIPDKVLRNLAPLIKKLSIKIKEAVGADGINIGMNNGATAGQEVMHAHIHIMPRFKGDGHKHWQGRAYKDGEIEEVGKKIRECIED